MWLSFRMEEIFSSSRTHPIQQTLSFVSPSRGEAGEVTLRPVRPPLEFGLELAFPVVLGQVGKEAT